MKTYRRRGVALNYDYFRRNISGNIPSLLVTITPAEWQWDSVNQYYYYQTSDNPLYGFEPLLWMLTETTSGTVYYSQLTSFPSFLEVYSTEVPPITLDLAVLPQNAVQTTQQTIQSSDFSFNGSEYTTSVDLSSYPSPVLVTFSSSGLPVYFDTQFTGGILTLKASSQPSFSTLLTIYHL